MYDTIRLLKISFSFLNLTGIYQVHQGENLLHSKFWTQACQREKSQCLLQSLGVTGACSVHMVLSLGKAVGNMDHNTSHSHLARLDGRSIYKHNSRVTAIHVSGPSTNTAHACQWHKGIIPFYFLHTKNKTPAVSILKVTDTELCMD